MQLSAELWKSLVSSIRCEHRKGSPEKRKNQRVQIRARITLTPLQDGRPVAGNVDVWTRDISGQGMSFTSNQRFSPQQQFLIELPWPRKVPLRLLATTRQCRKLADNVYCIGLIYQPMASESSQTASANAAYAA